MRKSTCFSALALDCLSTCVPWSGHIGSREGDVMGLCDVARDFRPCIVQIEENYEKTLCKKWSDTCARLRGSKGQEESQEAP